MLSEAMIDGQLRKLAPKHAEDVRIGDVCVLRRAAHDRPEMTVCEVVDRYKRTSWEKLLVAVRFGLTDEFSGYVIHIDDLLFPVEDKPVDSPEQARLSLDFKPTQRGFLRAEFVDLYGEPCSIQESSLAETEAIWLGANENRMHLDRRMAAVIGFSLQRFAETGELVSLDQIGAAPSNFTAPSTGANDEPRQPVIEDCEFRLGGPAAAPPSGERREHEVEPLNREQLLIKNADEGWLCNVHHHAPYAFTTRVSVPPNMPEPARAELRQWLTDRIVIEDQPGSDR